MRNLRAMVHRQIDPEMRPAGGLSLSNKVVMVLIGISIILGVLGTEHSISRDFHDTLISLDRVLLSIFVVELFARLWTCGLNPRFRGVRGFLRYLTQPATIADMIVIAPMFLPVPPTWMNIFRVLRILRILRLASFPKAKNAMAELGEALAAKRFELGLTAILCVLLVLFSSTTLYLCERASQPEAFGSIPRAIWWSVVTFTTVGYGDVIPVTAAGRFFAGIYAISGLGLVAMLTGVFASALSDAADRHSANRKTTNSQRKGS